LLLILQNKKNREFDCLTYYFFIVQSSVNPLVLISLKNLVLCFGSIVALL
jgi:hypothetical protein